MEKTVKIDGKAVKFKATALTPAKYRQMWQRDMFLDFDRLSKEYAAAKKSKGSLSSESLEIFYLIVYTMAKQADPEAVPDNADEWLDGFGIFSIYTVLPQIMELWGLSSMGIATPKKKAAVEPKES